MCRIAAFPPWFPRNRALETITDFERNNTDGIGSVYIKENKFVVDKHPMSLSSLLDTDNRFLSHMPYKGWTLVHLRAASHGPKAMRNTHPFIVGNKAVIHNGVWSEYNIAKLIIQRTSSRHFFGETDSEVAAHLLDIVGPKAFLKEVNFGGVFMALQINGKLDVIKTSGQLEAYRCSNKTMMLASEFPLGQFNKSVVLENGWYRYSANGKYKKCYLVEPEEDVYEEEEEDEDYLPSSSLTFHHPVSSPVNPILPRTHGFLTMGNMSHFTANPAWRPVLNRNED